MNFVEASVLAETIMTLCMSKVSDASQLNNSTSRTLFDYTNIELNSTKVSGQRLESNRSIPKKSEWKPSLNLSKVVKLQRSKNVKSSINLINAKGMEDSLAAATDKLKSTTQLKKQIKLKQLSRQGKYHDYSACNQIDSYTSRFFVIHVRECFQHHASSLINNYFEFRLKTETAQPSLIIR
jgi:alkyl sulfatase BDS1-like metallo-beta-lactamase superfamily hydrolase